MDVVTLTVVELACGGEGGVRQMNFVWILEICICLLRHNFIDNGIVSGGVHMQYLRKISGR